MIRKSNLIRKLYYSDNLSVLMGMEDDSIDLIYLDPPFNSNRAYNIIYPDDMGQVTAFEDTWYWTPECDVYLKDMAHLRARNILNALVDAMGKSQVCAYLVNMSVRLIEMQRILKSTGSIYLHCDPTASHYLKIVMDAIFGEKNFLNEIIWHYRKWPTGKYTFQRNHDVLLFYSGGSKAIERTFNQMYMERAESTKLRFGDAKIVSGFDDSGKRLPARMVDEQSEGVRQDDVWEIGRVPPVKQLFPTQKPLPLLERIIKVSSNEGDFVLDPFCGCGTTIIAAEKANRNWIGIDITYSAIAAIKSLYHQYKFNYWGDIQILGKPETEEEVETQLIKSESAKARKEFEKFCVTTVGGLPNDKMGADGGIDGRIPLLNKEVAVISVKSGNVNVRNIRELKGILNGKNKIGIFITKEKPTKEMTKFANQSGIYEYPDTALPMPQLIPKIQILTLEQVLRGEQPVLP